MSSVYESRWAVSLKALQVDVSAGSKCRSSRVVHEDRHDGVVGDTHAPSPIDGSLAVRIHCTWCQNGYFVRPWQSRREKYVMVACMLTWWRGGGKKKSAARTTQVLQQGSDRRQKLYPKPPTPYNICLRRERVLLPPLHHAKTGHDAGKHAIFGQRAQVHSRQLESLRGLIHSLTSKDALRPPVVEHLARRQSQSTGPFDQRTVSHPQLEILRMCLPVTHPSSARRPEDRNQQLQPQGTSPNKGRLARNRILWPSSG
jgi:hypothetical protein